MVGYDPYSARFHIAMPSDGAPEPLDPRTINSARDRMLVGDAVAQLSAEHWSVIRRSYHQGWTSAHIAADLAIAEGTVKSRLHYALRALRQTLRGLGVT
jgi:RNA polymerase sigma-70 factor, ECF subfamily